MPDADQAPPPTVGNRDEGHRAYSRMLQATSIVAGAKIATILVSMLRMKVVASLLGPQGLGFVNLISSSVDFTRVVTSMGLDGAVVRSVSEANANGDARQLSIIYRVAVRSALLLGISGWAILALVSPWISKLTTGDPGNAWMFSLAATSLVFTPLLGVQLALLQGLRQIKTLARCQVVASPVGAVIAVLLVVGFGKEGAIGALAATTLSSLLIHLAFIRKWKPAVSITEKIDYLHIIRSNLRDGSGFAINGIWQVAAGWLNLVLIRHHYGQEIGMINVGLYGAASMLANFYVGIVISALSTEFFPSLTAVAKDRPAMKEILNRQAVLALDAGVVFSLALIVTAPLALHILYSQDFQAATTIMRLILVGTAIRFASFPLGFALLAMGKARLFAICELAMGTITIGLSALLTYRFGLMGLGVAIISANFIQACGLWLITRRFEMSWDRRTRVAMATALITTALVLAASLLIPGVAGYLTSGVIAAIYGGFAVHRIQRGTGFSFATLLDRLRSKISP